MNRITGVRILVTGVSLAVLAAVVAAIVVMGSPWDPLESTCRHASLSIL